MCIYIYIHMCIYIYTYTHPYACMYLYIEKPRAGLDVRLDAAAGSPRHGTHRSSSLSSCDITCNYT